MKKERVIPIGILFATLCLVVTACTQGLDAGKGTGTVQVVIGGGAVRSVGANGLPEFDDTNTKITVTDEAGAQLAQGTTSVTLSVDIGKKITVEATITTAAGVWRGSAEHTVTKGANTVAVKLSKAPKDVASLMFSITGKAPSGGNIVSLSTKTKKLLDGILISSAKPVTARDNIGRIYVLYEDTSSNHFKRFDVEGKEDPSFDETAITGKLPSGVNISNIKTIAIDAKNNYIFLFNGDTVYCFKEKEDHSFESFGSAVFPITAVSVNITAAAAYTDVLFVTDGTTLYACKFEFEAASGHPGAQRLKFESTASSKSLDKLRTDTAFSNHRTECTGLFADASGVY